MVHVRVRVKIKWGLYCVTSNIRVRVKIKWAFYGATFEVQFKLKWFNIKCIHTQQIKCWN